MRRKRIMKRLYAGIMSAVMCVGLFGGIGVKTVKAAEEVLLLDAVSSDGSAESSDTEAASASDAASATDAEEIFSDSMEVDSGAATDNYDEVWKMMELVNAERVKAGRKKLVMDKRLMKAAEVRARELSVKFSTDTRPNGKDWDTVIDEQGVTDCLVCGENVAGGDFSADYVVPRQMLVYTLKQNILDSDYNAIGIACVDIPGSTYGRYWVQLFGGLWNPDVVMDATGIYVARSDKNGVNAGLTVYNPSGAELEYSWYASKDNGKTWLKAQDWKKGNEWLNWKPREYGDYVLVAKVRPAGDNNKHVYQSSTNFSFHPVIKGKCQMPYTGAGGGYLIGVESYDNPNQSYRYEMLILDCTLLAEGKPAWVYSTGKCAVPENALWTVWQPLYGYYWTLFRVYDKSGKMIDEVCYGFQNIY